MRITKCSPVYSSALQLAATSRAPAGSMYCPQHPLKSMHNLDGMHHEAKQIGAHSVPLQRGVERVAVCPWLAHSFKLPLASTPHNAACNACVLRMVPSVIINRTKAETC